MEELFNNVLSYVSADISPLSALICTAVAAALGGAVAFTYCKTQDDEVYQRSMAVTLFMLPMILSTVIVFVGSNIARAFSLAGVLAVVRFRSAPGDPKDIAYVFFAVAAGVSCGVGLYGYGALFTLILCVLIFLCEKFGLFKKKYVRKTLKITVPEDLNDTGVFDAVLEKYTKKHSLTSVRTADLGSLFELRYGLTVDNGADEKEMLDELRTLNGNLTIILSAAPAAMN